MIFVKRGERNHVSIPASERQVRVGTVANIRRQMGLSNEEFNRIVDEVL